MFVQLRYVLINDEFGLFLRRSNPQWKLKITSVEQKISCSLLAYGESQYHG
jgi:hypothetical protein